MLMYLGIVEHLDDFEANADAFAERMRKSKSCVKSMRNLKI